MKPAKWTQKRHRIDPRVPIRFSLLFRETMSEGVAGVTVYLDGKLIGNTLTDNAYDYIGYRYHDVMHAALAATLRWSPVLAGIASAEQQDDPMARRGEEAVAEEAIVAA